MRSQRALLRRRFDQSRCFLAAVVFPVERNYQGAFRPSAIAQGGGIFQRMRSIFEEEFFRIRSLSRGRRSAGGQPGIQSFEAKNRRTFFATFPVKGADCSFPAVDVNYCGAQHSARALVCGARQVTDNLFRFNCSQKSTTQVGKESPLTIAANERPFAFRSLKMRTNP